MDLPENFEWLCSRENRGYVDLRGLTSLPENVKFENGGGVYLRGLTSLPENVKFENRGNVYLSGLTSLPENVKFENRGNVDLSGLTSLPENVKFENGGGVYLRGLTSLPENVKFENGGYVDLRGLTDEYQTYCGKRIRLKHVDGYTMLITSEKKRGESTLYKARYFGGGPLSDLHSCWIAQQGEVYAHGASAAEALRDVAFKHAVENLNTDQIVEEIRTAGRITFNQFRLLTGACTGGLREGLRSRGQPEDLSDMDLAQALRLSRDSAFSLDRFFPETETMEAS